MRRALPKFRRIGYALCRFSKKCINSPSSRAKLQTRERQVIDLPERAAGDSSEQTELRAAIDRELNRLADIYRLPILLCDLEGKSIKTVAQHLNWPQGTVAGRLARGRQMLAKRLARHGLATVGGLGLLATLRWPMCRLDSFTPP
jgi:DNA-directed RNA polymerase specialized sigma24 family protein